jgi:hypothetical protein
VARCGRRELRLELFADQNKSHNYPQEILCWAAHRRHEDSLLSNDGQLLAPIFRLRSHKAQLLKVGDLRWLVILQKPQTEFAPPRRN